MELPPAVVSVVCCSDCHLHQKLSKHSERMYRVAFAELQARIFLPITKNQLPQYLVSFDPTFRLYRNKLNNHIQRFPEIGSFEVFYRNILVFSKLVSEHFPIVDQLVEIIRRIKEEQKTDPMLMKLSKFKLQFDFEKECFHIPEGSVFRNPQCFRQAQPQIKLLKKLPIVIEKVRKSKPKNQSLKSKKGPIRASIGIGIAPTQQTLSSTKSLTKRTLLVESKKQIYNKSWQKGEENFYNTTQSSTSSKKLLLRQQSSKQLKSNRRITNSNSKSGFVNQEPNPFYLTKEEDLSVSQSQQQITGNCPNFLPGTSCFARSDRHKGSQDFSSRQIIDQSSVTFSLGEEGKNQGIYLTDPLLHEDQNKENIENVNISTGCLEDKTAYLAIEDKTLLDSSTQKNNQQDNSPNPVTQPIEPLEEGQNRDPVHNIGQQISEHQEQKLIIKLQSEGEFIQCEQNTNNNEQIQQNERKSTEHSQINTCSPQEPLKGQPNTPLESQSDFLIASNKPEPIKMQDLRGITQKSQKLIEENQLEQKKEENMLLTNSIIQNKSIFKTQKSQSEKSINKTPQKIIIQEKIEERSFQIVENVQDQYNMQQPILFFAVKNLQATEMSESVCIQSIEKSLLFPESFSINTSFPNLHCALQVFKKIDFGLIRKLFSKTANNQHELLLNYPVWKKYTILNQFLFCHGKPMYCNGDLWEMLLQKAVATVLGGYNKLQEASLSDILTILSGMPSITSSTVKQNQTIFQSLSNPNIFIFATNLQKTKMCYRITEVNSGTDQLIYSLTPLNYEGTKRYQNDQILMTQRDFIKNFTQITLMHYYPNANVILIGMKKGRHLFNIENEDRGKCFIIIKNKDETQKQLSQKTKITLKNNGQLLGNLSRRGNFFFEIELAGLETYNFVISSPVDQYITFSSFPGKIRLLEQKSSKNKNIKKSHYYHDGDDESY